MIYNHRSGKLQIKGIMGSEYYILAHAIYPLPCHCPLDFKGMRGREIISECRNTHVNMRLGKRRCKPDCRLHKEQSQLQLKECLAVVKLIYQKITRGNAHRGCAVSEILKNRLDQDLSGALQ